MSEFDRLQSKSENEDPECACVYIAPDIVDPSGCPVHARDIDPEEYDPHYSD